MRASPQCRCPVVDKSWADRLVSANLPDTFSTAVPTFAWRADGLIKSRTFGAGSSVGFTYDRAKRVTQIAKGSLTLGQAYTRDGNVASETRSLGISGDAGTNTQTFSYDGLNRVLSSTGLGSGHNFTYEYDHDGNRTKKSDGTTTWTYGYDRTDQLSSVNGGPSAVGYNAFGDLTTKPEDDASTTTYAYDLGGKLTAIGRSGTADDASFAFDALGRFRTRVLASSTDTYSYLGTTEAVIRVDSSLANADIDSIITSAGDRLGIDGSSTMNWLLPDPHGSVAASLSSDEATVTNAIRYDPWGDTLVAGSGGGTAVGADKWKYQGRLDLSPSGIGESLYDFSARFYSPSLGVFTQVDSVIAGSAQNPLSMNRFLYAHANPTTLIDPSGHAICPYGPEDCAALANGGGNKPKTGAPAGGLAGPSGVKGGTGGQTTPKTAGANPGPKADQYWKDPKPIPFATITNDELDRLYRQWALAHGLDPITGCRLTDYLCNLGKQIHGLRIGVATLLGLIPIRGDAYQIGTVAAGYDPIADVSFTPEDQAQFGVIMIGRYGVGVSPAYARALGLVRVTVLGHGPNYKVLAKELGANYLNIPDNVWSKLEPWERREVNGRFLQDAIDRGDTFRFSDHPLAARAESMFEWELNFLVDHAEGYRLVEDGMALIPPPDRWR